MLKIADEPLKEDLNVFPLGSYDVLLGMEWLEKHCSLINYKTKTISYIDKKGERREIQGILMPLKPRSITALLLAKYIKKRCQIYAIQV